MTGQNVIQINGRITINVYVNVDMWKRLCEKDYVWNPATCNCENGKYLASIMDDSAIICDKVIDADMESNNKTNFNEKKATCKMQNLHILHVFFLISTAFLIAVSIYRYLIKYQRNLKQLLPFHFRNSNKVKI